MKEIVILTDRTGGDSRLLECLKALFPECEITVRPRGWSPPDEDSADSRPGAVPQI